MGRINLTIDNRPVTVPSGATILEAAKEAGIDIPTLCSEGDLVTKGNCRVCSVEVEGAPRLMTACSTAASEGMRVYTDSERVLRVRRVVVEILLSDHNRKCTGCEKNKACKLQEIADGLDILEQRYEPLFEVQNPKDYNALLVREANKCIKCGRCVDACGNAQRVYALAATKRGFQTDITFTPGDSVDLSGCIGCGECLLACPTGALHVNKHLSKFWSAIDDPEKFVVVLMQGDTETVLHKSAGRDEPLALSNGQLVGFFRSIGADRVLNAEAALPLTDLEREKERRSRPDGGPLLASDDPAVLRFIELHHPKLKKYLSAAKAPMERMGAEAKSFFAKELGVKPENITTVLVTGIPSHKLETDKAPGERSLDVVFSMEEIPLLAAQTMVVFPELMPGNFDPPVFKAEARAAADVTLLRSTAEVCELVEKNVI